MIFLNIPKKFFDRHTTQKTEIVYIYLQSKYLFIDSIRDIWWENVKMSF